MGKIEEGFYSSALLEIAELKTAKPELNEILEFYESVFKVQREAERLFNSGQNDIDYTRFAGRNGEGLSLLKSEDIQLDIEPVNNILEEMSGIIRNKWKEQIPADFNCRFLSEQKGVLVEGLMEDEVLLERMAGDLDVDYPVFYFLIKNAFSPFISNYAEKLQEAVEEKKWLKGNCPVCGSEPLIIRLVEETGKRKLFCSMCRTEWLYKRLACPFCENDDHESLRYFFVEDDEARRVDVCDKCKRYIKTIDNRKINKVTNLLVEYLSTLALDIVADKEGFRGGDIFLFTEK